MGLQTRAAAFAPATLNREDGTVDVVLSTGAAVRRSGFTERLAIGRENVTLAPRLPVLDSHRQSSIADVKGRVDSVRFESGAIVATLRISDPAALDAIERGDVTGVSIGYRVKTWADTTEAGARVRTATAWEMLEVSLVPVPADPAALIRSLPLELEITPEAQRLETRAAIRSIARTAGLDAAWADAQIDADTDVTTVRAAAFDAMQARPRPVIRTTVGVSSEDPSVILSRQTEALAARMGGPEASEAARPFAAWSAADFARDNLSRAGVPGLNSMGREELLTRAMHTVSDFPELLAGAGRRVLAGPYAAAQSVLKTVARQRNATDFRTMSVLRAGDFGKLAEVSEAGEIKSVSTSEVKEGFALKSFGGIYGLTFKALVNDDLGAMGQWMAQMGRAAAETEADQLVSLLTANAGAGPTMGDSVALFNATHGNLAGAATAITVAALSAARQAMRVQKGVDGKTVIGVAPAYLLVSPAKETEAEQVLATLAANTVSAVNPFSGSLQLLVEPRLQGNAWYLFAAPGAVPVLEYGYLASAPGPQLSSREAWETRGREFRIVLDFGCGATDFRGCYRNAGA